MARELYAQFEHAENGNDEAALAAALQRFMDVVERDALALDYADAHADVLERAEQAEARLAELVRRLDNWRDTIEGERINVITGRNVRAALSVLIAEYEGGEHG